ncbi:hypothetical protein FRB99_004272, partial [Tulasnella sp. 403]
MGGILSKDQSNTVVVIHGGRKRKVAMNPGLVVQGNFSDLYTGSEASLGVVALKRCRAAKDQKKVMEKEAETWRRLTHDNVLRFLGIGKDKEGTLYLVSPWMENRSLWDYIGNHPECNRPQFLRETAAALVYLHSQKVIHGDVKAQNILVSPTVHALLCDFGLSKIDKAPTDADAKGNGSLPFQAPEIWAGDSRTPESDTYAFGMTMYQAAGIINAASSGERPAKDPQMFPEGSASESYYGIAALCWVEERTERPSMDDVLQLLRKIGPAEGGPTAPLRGQ